MLDLEFSLSPKPTPYIPSDYDNWFEPEWQPMDYVRDAVLQRDLHVCQFCGFHSEKYQHCVQIDPDKDEFDSCVTACIFCESVLRVDTIERLRSGVLIWLPEMSQAELNQALRVVYLSRIYGNEHSNRASKLLDRIKSRRDTAKQNFGFNDPVVLAQHLRQEVGTMQINGTSTATDMMREGLRLLPLDRRVISEAYLEFNQFPQILAFWRSKRGPLNDRQKVSKDFQVLESRLSDL